MSLQKRLENYLFSPNQSDDSIPHLINFLNEHKIKLIGFDYVDVKITNKNNNLRTVSIHQNIDEYLKKVSNPFLKNYPSWLSYDKIINVEDYVIEGSKTNIGQIENWNNNFLNNFYREDVFPVVSINRNTVISFEDSKEYWNNLVKKFYPELTTFIYTKADVESTEYESACFLYLSDPNNILKENSPLISYLIKTLHTFQYGRIGTYILPIQLRKAQKQTIKSSLASIVARGLSHCDGSHSMIYFELNFKELLKKQEYKLAEQQFGYYNQHLREVMELNADISGGIGNQTSYQFNLKNVLNSINKPQNNETSAIYFPNKEDVKNSLYRKSRNGLVRNKEEYQVRTFISDAIVDNKFRCCLDFNDSCDVKVLFPGGTNSKTALIQILKNIYRNIFKHNYTKPKNNILNNDEVDCVSLSIRIDKTENELLEKHYYKLIITESVTTSVDKFKRLKDIVKKNILTDSGEVDSKAWGIKEIKIQAAYLIGLAIENLNDDKDIFRLRFPKKDWYNVKHNNDGKLEHNLYLKKEKKALVVVEDEDLEKELNTCENNDKGLYYKYLNNLSDWHKGIDRDFEYIIFHKNHQPLIPNEKKAYKSRNFKILITDELFKKEGVASLNKGWVREFYLEDADFNYFKKRVNSGEVLFGDSHFLDVKEDNNKWEEIEYYEALKDKYVNDFEKKLCVNTRIAILDERIQEYVCKNKNNNFNNEDVFERDIFEKKGIVIPNLELLDLYNLFYPSEVESNDTNSNNDFKEFNKLLCDYFYEEKMDYVVVHFSGLEAIANRLSDKEIKDMREQVSNHTGIAYDELKKPANIEVVYSYLVKCTLQLPKRNKYLILTSGKGTPKTLPNHSFFINLNNIEHLVKSKNKTKLDFVKTLQSIRQIEN